MTKVNYLLSMKNLFDQYKWMSYTLVNADRGRTKLLSLLKLSMYNYSFLNKQNQLATVEWPDVCRCYVKDLLDLIIQFVLPECLLNVLHSFGFLNWPLHKGLPVSPSFSTRSKWQRHFTVNWRYCNHVHRLICSDFIFRHRIHWQYPLQKVKTHSKKKWGHEYDTKLNLIVRLCFCRSE